MSCNSSTDALNASMMCRQSASLCAVVRKHGKLSRICTPRQRIIANSRSCSGCSSRKRRLPQRGEVLDTRWARLTAPQNALISSTIAAVRALSASCNAGPCRLQVLQRRLGRGQRERVAYERAGEIGHAHAGHGRVAELPGAAVDRIHELATAGDHADRKAAANHLAVGGEVGAGCRTAPVRRPDASGIR